MLRTFYRERERGHCKMAFGDEGDYQGLQFEVRYIYPLEIGGPIEDSSISSKQRIDQDSKDLNEMKKNLVIS